VALALPAFRSALEREEARQVLEPDLPAVQWLASRGRRDASSPTDWRAWLLSRFGPGPAALASCPAGPAVRALASGRLDEGFWACAQPVHLLTALDHVRLAPLADLGRAPEEARALADSINASLAGSGYSLQPVESAISALACPTEIHCDTVDPSRVEGRDIRDWLPAGRDGLQVRKLMNELQMLLHEHPVNVRRAERGLLPANALWLWGFGRAQERVGTALPALCTDDAWLRGLWRLHGGSAQPLRTAMQALTTERALLVAAAAIGGDPGDELARWDAELAAPLAAALRAGHIEDAGLLLGDVSYALAHADRFAVWRRRRPWTELLA
jgi:hypothetical protein